MMVRGKRLTATELADALARSAGVMASQDRCGAAGAVDAAVDLIREHLVPRYESVRADMPDGWYWCEELEADSPPQKCAWHSCGVDSEGQDVSPILKRWTIGGWASVTGRVCPIERPEGLRVREVPS